jgi:anti-sigma factor RsiW
MNIRENLKAYLDGELTPQEMDVMREAIERDPSLQEEVQFGH